MSKADFMRFIAEVAAPFWAALVGAILTFLMNVKKKKEALIHLIVESVFSVFFGSICGYIAVSFSAPQNWVIVISSACGAFAPKLYAKIDKKIDETEIDDIIDFDK